jgi:hypothetical protein
VWSARRLRCAYTLNLANHVLSAPTMYIMRPPRRDRVSREAVTITCARTHTHTHTHTHTRAHTHTQQKTRLGGRTLSRETLQLVHGEDFVCVHFEVLVPILLHALWPLQAAAAQALLKSSIKRQEKSEQCARRRGLERAHAPVDTKGPRGRDGDRVPQVSQESRLRARPTVANPRKLRLGVSSVER